MRAQGRSSRSSGIAVIAALALVVVSAMLAWAFMNTAQADLMTSFRVASDIRAFHLAEAGIRHFLAEGADLAREEPIRFELATGTVEVTTERLAGGATRLRSQGTSGAVVRSIVLIYSADGVPLRRYEE